MLDFVEPPPKLERQDNRELRAKILALTSPEAKQLGIGKSTLHDLRSKAGSQNSFHMYYKARSRLKKAKAVVCNN